MRISDEISGLDAASVDVQLGDEDPVGGDGHGGEHGRAERGADAEEFVPDEVREEDAFCGDGEELELVWDGHCGGSDEAVGVKGDWWRWRGIGGGGIFEIELRLESGCELYR